MENRDRVEEQQKSDSLAEAVTNTVVGFGINYTANWFILPLFFQTHITPMQNLSIGLLFTLISVARGYVLRRLFTGRNIFTRRG